MPSKGPEKKIRGQPHKKIKIIKYISTEKIPNSQGALDYWFLTKQYQCVQVCVEGVHSVLVYLSHRI